MTWDTMGTVFSGELAGCMGRELVCRTDCRYSTVGHMYTRHDKTALALWAFGATPISSESPF